MVSYAGLLAVGNSSNNRFKIIPWNHRQTGLDTTPEIEWYVTDDVAVATGVIEAKAMRAGKAVPATTFRFTRIYSRENGSWKVLLFQNAMIP